MRFCVKRGNYIALCLSFVWRLKGLNRLLPVVDGFEGRGGGGCEADEASMCTV